jgi:hypothetical protein
LRPAKFRQPLLSGVFEHAPLSVSPRESLESFVTQTSPAKEKSVSANDNELSTALDRATAEAVRKYRHRFNQQSRIIVEGGTEGYTKFSGPKILDDGTDAYILDFSKGANDPPGERMRPVLVMVDSHLVKHVSGNQRVEMEMEPGRAAKVTMSGSHSRNNSVDSKKVINVGGACYEGRCGSQYVKNFWKKTLGRRPSFPRSSQFFPSYPDYIGAESPLVARPRSNGKEMATEKPMAIP